MQQVQENYSTVRSHWVWRNRNKSWTAWEVGWGMCIVLLVLTNH